MSNTVLVYKSGAALSATFKDNVDQVDYVDKLREQCINAYTGMLQVSIIMIDVFINCLLQIPLVSKFNINVLTGTSR